MAERKTPRFRPTTAATCSDEAAAKARPRGAFPQQPIGAIPHVALLPAPDDGLALPRGRPDRHRARAICVAISTIRARQAWCCRLLRSATTPSSRSRSSGQSRTSTPSLMRPHPQVQGSMRSINANQTLRTRHIELLATTHPQTAGAIFIRIDCAHSSSTDCKVSLLSVAAGRYRQRRTPCALAERMRRWRINHDRPRAPG